MKKKVGIVVVTYNRLTLLKEELETLRNQTYNDFQIIVVNNGSTDDTVNWLANQEDIITITQENLGGAGGFFTGMKYVAENDYKYCWIMDDDVICEPNALEELVKAIDAKANIGFVCSNVLGTDGSPMNTPVVYERSRSSITGYPDYFDMANFSMVKVIRATFVSVLFNTEIIKREGLPYRDYFIWGDDTEYTTRFSAKYPCYVALKSTVVHKRSIQKTIQLEHETDPKRLYMHTLQFRNESFTAIAHKKSSKVNCLLELYKKALKLLLKGHLVAAKIYLKSARMLWNFNPSIEYPQNRVLS